MHMLVNTASRTVATTTKAHLRKLHTSTGTTVRANCGCSWTVATSDPNKVEDVIAAAFEHRHQTGHVIDIRGILR